MNPAYIETSAHFLVTAIPNANTLEVTDIRAGSSEMLAMSPGIQAENLAARLAALSMLVSEGSIEMAPLRAQLRESQRDSRISHPVTATNASKCIRGLAKFLPPEIISYEGAPEKLTSVKLGNIAVASRWASDEEAAQIKENIAAKAKAEALANDIGKTDLTAHAHAIITVNEKRYLLELLSPMSILSARVIELLSEEDMNIDYIDLANKAWQAMTIAERTLFCKPDSARMYEATHPALYDDIHTVLRLTSLMGITRNRYGNVHSKKAEKPDSSVVYEEIPLTEADPDLLPIYPPETDRNYITTRLHNLVIDEEKPPTEEDLAYARLLVTDFVNTKRLVRLKPQQAIALLDFIMDRQGKKALEKIIEQTPDSQPLGMSLAQLHVIAKKSLGHSPYQIAFQNRTIAGGHMTGNRGNVIQLTGAVPKLDAPAARPTTRWYIGSGFIPPTPKDAKR